MALSICFRFTFKTFIISCCTCFSIINIRIFYDTFLSGVKKHNLVSAQTITKLIDTYINIWQWFVCSTSLLRSKVFYETALNLRIYEI
jgi:hypothetical protein